MLFDRTLVSILHLRRLYASSAIAVSGSAVVFRPSAARRRSAPQVIEPVKFRKVKRRLLTERRRFSTADEFERLKHAGRRCRTFCAAPRGVHDRQRSKAAPRLHTPWENRQHRDDPDCLPPRRRGSRGLVTKGGISLIGLPYPFCSPNRRLARQAGPCFARIARGRGRPLAPARFARLIARARQSTHLSRSFCWGSFSRRRATGDEAAPRMPLPSSRPILPQVPRMSSHVEELSQLS